MDSKAVSEKFLLLTTHGLPNIFRAKKTIGLLFWIFCFILSVGLCCAFVVQSVLQYLSFEVTTKSRIIPVLNLEFPTIKICNLNPFSTEYGIEYFAEYFREYQQSQNSYGIKLNENITNLEIFNNNLQLIKMTGLSRMSPLNFTDEQKKKLVYP